MPSWYLGKIKFQHEAENGMLVTVKEEYLLDCVSFTDAETRLYEIVSANTPDFQVESLAKAKISDIFEYDEQGHYFKGKMSYVDVTEGGKEKRTVITVYVNASDIEQALIKLKKEFSNMLIPYEINELIQTKVLEIFRYTGSEEKTVADPVESPGFIKLDDGEIF